MNQVLKAKQLIFFILLELWWFCIEVMGYFEK